MSHTPGPWHWEPGHEINWGPAIYTGDDPPDTWDDADAERYVAEVISHGDESTEANAHLIAAAPSLLEALETLLREHDTGSAIPNRLGYWDNAREAIVLARGEIGMAKK